MDLLLWVALLKPVETSRPRAMKIPSGMSVRLRRSARRWIETPILSVGNLVEQIRLRLSEVGGGDREGDRLTLVADGLHHHAPA